MLYATLKAVFHPASSRVRSHRTKAGVSPDVTMVAKWLDDAADMFYTDMSVYDTPTRFFPQIEGITRIDTLDQSVHMKEKSFRFGYPTDTKHIGDFFSKLMTQFEGFTRFLIGDVTTIPSWILAHIIRHDMYMNLYRIDPTFVIPFLQDYVPRMNVKLKHDEDENPLGFVLEDYPQKISNRKERFGRSISAVTDELGGICPHVHSLLNETDPKRLKLLVSHFVTLLLSVTGDDDCGVIVV